MRSHRLTGQASIFFLISVLFIYTFLFAIVPSVLAASGNPEHDLQINGSAPRVLLQEGGVDVQVGVTAAFPSVSAGEAVSFNITVINASLADAQSVTLTGSLPAGLNWAIKAVTFNNSAQPQCTVDNGVLTCNVASMGATGFFLVKVSAPTSFSACQTLTVQATVAAANETPEFTGNNTKSASTTVLCPSLSITKTANPPKVMAGNPAVFDISVVNNGQGTAVGIQIEDPLPGNGALTWQVATPGTACSITDNVLTCLPFDLTPGARFDVSVHAQTNQNACGTYPNTVIVSAANHPAVQQSAVVDVLCSALMLEKTTDTPSVSAGDPIRFTIKVSNPSTVDAQNVVLTDSLPKQAGLSWHLVDPVPQGCVIANGSFICSFPTLPSGQSYTVIVTSPTTFDSCSTVTNQAHVTDGAGHAADASASATVLCPQLALSKTAVETAVDYGASLNFTLLVSNSGQGNGKNVHLDDPLPGNVQWSVDNTACQIQNNRLTCDWPDLAPTGGQPVQIHLSGTPLSISACGTLNNTATLTASNFTTLQSSASITITCPDVRVEKTADKTPLQPGDTASFTIIARNTGTGTARNVIVVDTLPSGFGWTADHAACQVSDQSLSCSLGDLQEGQAVTLKVSGVITTACGLITNQAAISASNEPEALKGNNTAQASINVVCVTLALEKTTDTPKVSAGDPIRFSLKVTSLATASVQNVVLTDNLPSQAGLIWQIADPAPQGCVIVNNVLSCSFPDLPGGESQLVTVTSPTTFDSCATVTNLAHVSDAAGHTADASASLEIQCPQLAISKSANPTTVGYGAGLNFTILVSNAGLGSGKSVRLEDPLPGNVNWAVDNAACQIQNSRLTCDWPVLAPTGQQPIAIHLTGNPTSLSACGTLNNTATLTAANFAAVQSSASITVTCPDVRVEKTADKTPLRKGDTAGFTIVARNAGTGTASNVTLVDALPSGITWKVDNTACQFSGQTLTCNLGSLQQGQSITLKVTGYVSSTCKVLTNKVTISASNEPDELKGNNSAQASISVLCLEDLKVQKTATPTFDRVYDWSISKTASPSNAWKYGGSAEIAYAVTAAQTGIHDANYRVSGKILITNPNSTTAISGVTATDQINNGGSCQVTNGNNITIPAGATVQLDYVCSYTSAPSTKSGINSVTVVWAASSGTPSNSATANASFVFGDGSQNNPLSVYQTITVTDTWNNVTTKLGNVSGTSSQPYATGIFKYTKTVQVVPGCNNYTNTARIAETNQSSSAKTVICGPLNTGAKPTSFWRKQGAEIIRSLDNNPSCILTPWLRQFPPFQDLSVKAPCSAVASYVKAVIDKAGSPKSGIKENLKAEALATALNIFFSDPSLGGNRISAPSPIGSYTIDLTHICSGASGSECTLIDTSSSFGGKSSLTILKALSVSAEQASPGGCFWYGNDVNKMNLAMETFRAINNQRVFPPVP